MSSTLTHSELSTEARKSLRKLDRFQTAVSKFFTELSQHRLAIWIALLALLLTGAAVALWSSHHENQNALAQAALFDAKKTMDQELKAVAAAMAPAQAAAPAQDGKTAPKAEPKADAIAYTRFDVDQKAPEAVRKLQSVAEKHGKTTAGYEARLLLGDLYFDHGQAGKAAPWYSRAVDAASGPFHRGLALYSLGYAQENDGKPAEALKTYEKAMNSGALDLKGDLLLATARAYRAMNDQAKARSTYDQILSQLPDTDYAKTARVLKDELH